MKKSENWNDYTGWVAHFDVLGFKELISSNNDSLDSDVLKSQIDDAISYLKNHINNCGGHIDFRFYADTFIIYSTTSLEVTDMPLIGVCQQFIYRCISIGVPVRGAISYGEFRIGYDGKIVIGPAILESYHYGEDQNWLGLILAPSALARLNGLNLASLGFLNCDVPMRKFSFFEVYAYRFLPGGTTTIPSNPLLRSLEEMMRKVSDKGVKIKYENTINFIKRHWPYIGARTCP